MDSEPEWNQVVFALIGIGIKTFDLLWNWIGIKGFRNQESLIPTPYHATCGLAPGRFRVPNLTSPMAPGKKGNRNTAYSAKDLVYRPNGLGRRSCDRLTH